MEAFGGDVVAVVLKLDLNQVVLVGHSMGGHVIVEVARQIPDRVLGLVGADAFHDVESRLTPEEFDVRFAKFYEDFGKSTREFVRTLFAPTADPFLVESVAADMAETPLEVGLGAAKGARHGYDLARAMEDVQTPIRCINSDWIETNVDAAQRHAASFEVVTMSNIGHFVMMEDPDVFNQHLAEIINEFVALSNTSH
jgi:pimeloyl-ACP methyl ester carboxylesterase